MTERDPRTVFVADTGKLADAVIELLGVNGIAAEIQQTPPPPTSALTGLAEEGTPEEYPILVTDSAKLDEARELLSTAEKIATVRAIANRRAERTGTVKATCEECGKDSEWHATAMGTTELCPHCGAYMDIPDPDDDWGNMDFGKPEEDNDEE